MFLEVAATELTAAAVVVIFLVVAAAVDFLLLVLHNQSLCFLLPYFFQSAIQNRGCMLYMGVHFVQGNTVVVVVVVVVAK